MDVIDYRAFTIYFNEIIHMGIKNLIFDIKENNEVIRESKTFIYNILKLTITVLRKLLSMHLILRI